MSGALVRVILNLLLADVTFNPFFPGSDSGYSSTVADLCGNGTA